MRGVVCKGSVVLAFGSVKTGFKTGVLSKSGFTCNAGAKSCVMGLEECNTFCSNSVTLPISL